MLIGYKVLGIAPSGKKSLYARCETIEGATLLAEEAARVGWCDVEWSNLYHWEQWAKGV